MFQHIAGFCNSQALTNRYSSLESPCRHEVWTISSSLCFIEGALHMASEDSQFLNVAMISSSLRRRLPPRFIGPLNEKTCSMPETERCRPDRIKFSDRAEDRKVFRFDSQLNRSKNGKTAASDRSACDRKVEDTVSAPSNRSRSRRPNHGLELSVPVCETWNDSETLPWQSTSRSRRMQDVEASFTIDESSTSPSLGIRSSQLEEQGRFLLIVRTGRIFTSHVTSPSRWV